MGIYILCSWTVSPLYLHSCVFFQIGAFHFLGIFLNLIKLTIVAGPPNSMERRMINPRNAWGKAGNGRMSTSSALPFLQKAFCARNLP